MFNRLIFLTLTLFPLVQYNVVRAETKDPLIASVSRDPLPPPQFKSTTLSGQLREALEHSAETGDTYYLEYLRDRHEKNAEEVLKLLIPYVNDSNPAIRASLVDMAAWKNSNASFELMALLCGDRDRDIRLRVVSLLEGGYSQQQVREWGGSNFYKTIKRAFILNDYAKEEVLLLSLFGDKKDVNYLQQRLIAYREYGERAQKETWHQQKICIDIALTRLGEKDAHERLLERFRRADKEDCLVLLHYLKWLPDEALVSSALELTKDKRNVFNAPPPSPEYTVSRTRICDIAFNMFWRIMPIPKLKRKSGEALTDAQFIAGYDYWRDNLTNIRRKAQTVISKL